MNLIVDCRATDVHAQLARLDGLESFFTVILAVVDEHKNSSIVVVCADFNALVQRADSGPIFRQAKPQPTQQFPRLDPQSLDARSWWP